MSTRRDGVRAVVEVRGDLDLESRGLFASELGRAMVSQPEALEVDAGDLAFIDSAGLQAVLVARDEAEAAGVGFRLVAVSATVRRVIELAGLADVLLDPSRPYGVD